MKKDFYGYYYKLEKGMTHLALIVARHGDTASLQIVTDDTNQTLAYKADAFSEIREKDGTLTIRLGNSVFSDHGICLREKTADTDLRGDLRFSNRVRPQGDIMGPFRFVPHMECRHMLRSIRYTVHGQLNYNGKKYDFSGGTGYTEGDRGVSFPSPYFWTHSFFADGKSLMLAVARIPYMGLAFTGTIGFYYDGSREHRFATYRGARVLTFRDRTVRVKQGKYLLSVVPGNTDGRKLLAPVNGNMTRKIRETLSGEVRYQLICGKRVLLDEVAACASYEWEVPEVKESER